MRRARAASLLTLTLVLACSSPAPDSTVRTSLPAGVVARVGTTDIAATTVAGIAQAQQLSTRAAADRAISDALFSLALRSEPAARSAAITQVVTRSAHARALVATVQQAAAAAGPATDDEIAKLTAERWLELDRAAAVRTTHAVAVVKEPADAAAARALIERVAQEVASVREAGAFMERASALGKEGPVELKVERLPALLPDGRSFDPTSLKEGATFDEVFTRAAHAIASAGDQSPVVKTRFGYHVILLEERLPEQRVSLEERRRLLGEVAIVRRAERELGALLARLRGSTALEVSRAVEQLTAEVDVGR